MGTGRCFVDYIISTAQIQVAAEKIACTLWPVRLLTDPERDRRGQDAIHEDGRRIQIKGDQYMAKSKNLYIELYEKTRGNNSQQWRVSPHLADAYISITWGVALLVPISTIAEAAMWWEARQISQTSAGLLIPIKHLKHYEKVTHDLWPWAPADTPIVVKNQFGLFSLEDVTERNYH